MMNPSSPLSRAGDDLLLTIRLTPRAALDRIDGLDRLSDGRAVLKARVRAVPESGKANAALLKLLAVALDIPQRRLALAGGDTARLKTIRIFDVDQVLADRINDLVAVTR